MLTLYNVISADGYITTLEGDESFIPDSLWPTVLEVFAEYPVFMMSSSTYEALQHYDDNLLLQFEKLPIRKVVVSRKPNFHVRPGYEVVQTAQRILDENEKVIVSSGSIFNTYLLQNKLVDEIILHRLPKVLGDGIKPFDDKFFSDFNLMSESPRGQVVELIYKRK